MNILGMTLSALSPQLESPGRIELWGSEHDRQQGCRFGNQTARVLSPVLLLLALGPEEISFL